MKVSLSWLRDYLTTEQTAEQLAETLTRSGLEVKSIMSHGAAIPKVVAAQILESTQHPNADRLSVCKVDEGSGTPRQIVCGAKNYKVGDKILLALPGAVLPGDVKIKVGKLRGVESEGMMCSSKELHLNSTETANNCVASSASSSISDTLSRCAPSAPCSSSASANLKSNSDNKGDGLLILPPETKIGTELSELFPSDEVLELEVTPNRPDWLGYLGVAREAAVFGAGEEKFTGMEEMEGIKKKISFEFPSAIEEKNVAKIEAPHACSFYSIRRIENINMNPSPAWLVQRLSVMDARSINLVVDLANYVMFETGQPLHAFDAAKIKGALNVRFAREGETLEALDGKNYKLQTSDLVIADDEGPQALAGIIGGMKSGVAQSTTSILLESAVFDPATIAASLRFHGIHTEAGYRFERNNRANTLEASARMVALLAEWGGGEASEKLFIAGALPERLYINLQGDQVRRLLGAEISDEQIDSYLQKLGLKNLSSKSTDAANNCVAPVLAPSSMSIYTQSLRAVPPSSSLASATFKTDSDKKENTWLVPSWRPDLLRSVDLIEEVARVHGIEAITPRCMAFAAPSSKEDCAYDKMMTLRRRLAAGGFFEARTGTLVAREVADERAIALRNPMGEQQAVLRTSLLPGLKKVLQHNLQQGASAVRVFELGTVFHQATIVHEEEKFSLALIATGDAVPISWRQATQRSLDLYDLKGIIDHLVPGEMSYEGWKEPLLSGMSLMVRVLCGKEYVGYLGLLHPAAARELMLTGQEHPVVVAELDVALLCSNNWGQAMILDKELKKTELESSILVKNHSLTPIALPRFPAVTRDLALIVNKSIEYTALEEALLSAKEELLRKITPFDIFTDPSGKKIPADKKSVALSLKFQHDERTLTTEEVNQACERLIASLEKSLGAVVRS